MSILGPQILITENSREVHHTYRGLTKIVPQSVLKEEMCSLEVLIRIFLGSSRY